MRLHLVCLQETVALLVIVLDEMRVLKRMLTLREAVTQRQLDRIAERLNQSLVGLNRVQIKSLSFTLDSLEQTILCASQEVMKESEEADLPEHHVEGLSRLLNQPEFAAGERARLLVKMIEERVMVERVIATTRESDPRVTIGAENREESLRPFGVIVCRYGRPGGVGGAICVVGPTRMSYQVGIAGIRHLAAFMNRMVQSLESADEAPC